MSKRLAALAGAGLLSLMGGAAAADTTYDNEAAFDAAAGSLTTLTFDGIVTPPNTFNSYGAGPLTLSGVTFTGNGDLFVVAPAYYGTSYPNDFLTSDYAASGTDTITIDLPSTKAIGFNFGGLFGPVTFTVNTSDGGAFTPSTDQSINGTASLGFFGVIASTPITSLTISAPDGGDYNAIDNFSFSAVPEPGAWAMMLLGFSAFGAALRLGRSRRSIAAA